MVARVPYISNVSDVDIRLLRLFSAVVECGGFAAAEAQLQTSLSTISKHVKDLETRLGVRLCRRGRSGFALTAQGREVHMAAQQLFGALESFRSRMNGIHTEVVGELNLGVIDTVITDPNFRLARVLAAVKRRAPKVRVNVFMDPPNYLEKALLDDVLHVAIITVRQRLPGLDYQPLYSETNNLYCAETHRSFTRCPSSVSLDELAGCELVGRTYAAQEEASNLQNIPIRTATANDVEGVAMLVLTGRYIGYLPDHYVSATKFPVRLRQLLPERFGYDVTMELATRARTAQPPAMASFLAEMGREFGENAKSLGMNVK